MSKPWRVARWVAVAIWLAAFVLVAVGRGSSFLIVSFGLIFAGELVHAVLSEALAE